MRMPFTFPIARVVAAVLLATLAGVVPAAPQFRIDMGTPQYLDSHSIGTNGEGGLQFIFLLLNGETANPPFTMRTQLPPHVSFRGFAGGGWSCSAAAADVTCVYSHPLTAANWSSSAVNLYVDVDGNLPVPGSSTVRMTLEHALVPLPAPLVCQDTPVANYATSTTGCVERAVSHRASQLVFVPAAWQHTQPVFEAGTRGTVQAAWRSIGFGMSNGTVTARFLLPPGLTYYAHGGITQWTCNAAAPDQQGQLLTCTTPGWFDGINESQANIVLHLDVAPDVTVPGPLPILATISNAAQPPPDFPLCDDPSPPVGCGYHSVPTRAARLSRMDILAIEPARPRFNQGEEAQLVVTYSNIGEGDASAATLSFALPPGFGYARNTASPTLACAVAAGTPATGQFLACRYAATFPAGVQGALNLFLDVLPGSTPQSLLVGSVSDDGRPGPTLQQCIDEPASPVPMIGCGRTVLQVSPWIFCNGFERLGRVCGEPQRF